MNLIKRVFSKIKKCKTALVERLIRVIVATYDIKSALMSHLLPF